MKDIWLISDTHFNHENIIKYCDRPYTDAEHMNEDLIEKWNSVVKPGDKVYHLGDVFMGSGEKAYDIHKRLLGKKRLILGNHDDPNHAVIRKWYQKVSVWRDLRDYGLVLSHIPLHPSAIKKGRINVHGHIHNHRSPDGLYLCACVEQINYTPIHIEEVRDKARKIAKEYGLDFTG